MYSKMLPKNLKKLIIIQKLPSYMQSKESFNIVESKNRLFPEKCLPEETIDHSSNLNYSFDELV